MEQDFWNNQELIHTIKNGGVAVMPTDTIYGIVGKAEEERVVERIYKIRNRNGGKPCIILLDSFAKVDKFGIVLTEAQQDFLMKEFLVPTSVILDCPNQDFEYLHRGTYSLAFRRPKNLNLQKLLSITGPLIAPSANTEGATPAININQAKGYFGNKVDTYIDGGEICGNPSKVVRLSKDGNIFIIRE